MIYRAWENITIVMVILMDANKEKDNKNLNISGVVSLQHPVVLIWLISTLLFIVSGYIYSSALLS
ncbi:hypothetical protein IKQ26_04580 [bacterium]|nr:hypothetical protein [bacterium]